MACGFLQGAAGQLVGDGHHRELGVARDQVVRKGAQQLVAVGAAPVEVQADPALRQQPGREVAPARCLRVADCLDGEAVLGEPLRRRRVQGGEVV